MDDELLQMDDKFRRPFCAPRVERWKNFGCVSLEERLACHREETVVSLLESMASAEGKISCLAAMLFGDGGLLTCFGFRRLRDVCWRLCTHHQTHGCA